MLIPCGHRLLIKPDPIEEKTQSGIILAVDERLARANMDKGTVVRIGKTAFKDLGGEKWCDVGDRIIYARGAPKIVEDPDTGEPYAILNDEDVCAIERKGSV
jgi:co-chaperonin GroES (HSP10)